MGKRKDSTTETIHTSQQPTSTKRLAPNPPSQEDQEDDIDDQPEQLDNNEPRRTYLLTYSQIDRTLFPTRESFAKKCAIALGGDKVVAFYACAEEAHRDGGTHYHVSIKLNAPKRWKSAKVDLLRAGAIVHFAKPKDGKEGMYAWAYKYVTKYDNNVYHSSNHPTLERVTHVRAANANRVYRSNRAAAAAARNAGDSNEEKKKVERLTKLEVGEYCVEKGIKTLTELMADAEVRKREGDLSLASFIYNGNGLKSARETIEIAWTMHHSVQKLANLRTPRMERLRSAAAEDCVVGCGGTWLTYALEVLHKNDINKFEYAGAIRNLLLNGRGKKRNILLAGPGNTAKTFLLRPLEKVYPETFSTPAGSSFAWITADEASVIFLNDYRWHSKLCGGNIEWGQFLNLLEGLDSTLPAPMNSHSRHIKITGDVPIFATSPRDITWYANREDEARTDKHDEEDFQMSERWLKFKLTHKFVGANQVADIPVCGACFGNLILSGDNGN